MLENADGCGGKRATAESLLQAATVGQEFHDEITGADGTITLFTLDGGPMLGLRERTNLGTDASPPPGSTEFSLAGWSPQRSRLSPRSLTSSQR